MDNPKVIVREGNKFGKAVFAMKNILKDEMIAEFDGEIYDWDYEGWNQELYDHVIQFEKRKWRDSKGIARWINHSCEPNCGIKDMFKIVAMRDIQRGEEITWDYEMTENHPWWRMKCECGNKNCRKVIGSYDNMPQVVRDTYKGYISEWLTRK
jgi:hypothetical protein